VVVFNGDSRHRGGGGSGSPYTLGTMVVVVLVVAMSRRRGSVIYYTCRAKNKNKPRARHASACRSLFVFDGISVWCCKVADRCCRSSRTHSLVVKKSFSRAKKVKIKNDIPRHRDNLCLEPHLSLTMTLVVC